MNEESLFVSALELPDAAARRAFLDQACAGDDRLRRRVQQLLDADEDAGILDRTNVASPFVELGRAEAPLAAGETYARRFVLRQKLGEGGMGEVWVADQTEPVRRRVAVKVIRPGLASARLLARFEQERQALAMMSHPNIAKVLDAGVEGGRPFFVMELIEGLPLTRHCDEARLNVRERLGLFLQVCQAVQHAHQKGVIHRDLKPSNVLVESHDIDSVPKVIDFGLAKLAGPPHLGQNVSTEIGTVVGTLEYMSPEQADLNSLDIDTRSDVYSLGVVLYELLTGSVPHSRKDLQSAGFAEMLRIIKEVEPPSLGNRLNSDAGLEGIAAARGTEPKKLLAQARGDLEWVVSKCLEKEPTRRYDTASELAADLRRYLADEPVIAGPPSAGYRLRKFLRRKRGPVLAGAFVLLALAAGAIGTTVGLVQAVQARRAEAERAEGERLAKEVAEKRLEQFEKGIDTLGAIFEDIDPQAEEKDGRPLRAILGERLDLAAASLEGEVVTDPLIVARLQDRLGRTYLGLGHASKAEALLVKAAATRRRLLGDDDLLTLGSLRRLSRAYHHAGKAQQALALTEQVHEASLKSFGGRHPETLQARKDLARSYQDLGKLPRAIVLLEQVRDVELQLFGPDDPATLTTLHNLAWAYHGAGKLPAAIALLEQVWAAREKRLGHGHTETLATLTTLALAYRGVGNTGRAIELYERAHALQARNLGSDHERTLLTLSNMAGAYLGAGKPARAIHLLEQVRDAQVIKHGAGHRYTLITLTSLATAYQNSGKLPEAIELFARVREGLAKQFEAGHPELLSSLNNLGGAYYLADKWPLALPLFLEAAVGIEKQQFQHPYAGSILSNLCGCLEKLQQHTEAEPWLRKWRAVMKERHGSESPAYASTLAAFGSNQLDQRKWAEAETALRECLAIRRRKEPEDWRTCNTHSLLGAALLGQQKYAHAEPMLLQGYLGMKKAAPPRKRLGEALERLVRLYEAWGKPEEAAKWRKERGEQGPGPGKVTKP